MKTVPSAASVSDFLDGVTDPRRRADARAVADLLSRVTGAEPVMWGPSIVGYGLVRLRSGSGGETDWMEVGFSPRKTATTLYLTDGFTSHTELLGRLGPHSVGKSCLHLKRVDDVDQNVLAELVRASVQHVRSMS